MTTVLVVEDDPASREGLAAAVREMGLEVVEAESGEEAVSRLQLAPADIILTDVVMGRMGGFDLLRHVRESYPDTAVVLVTGQGSIQAAVEAMRQGAYDYLTKPVDLDRLQVVLDRARGRQTLLRENRRLRRELRGAFSASGIVGQSRAMANVLRQVEQVAPTNATVLLLGESGTGKELIATAIHYHSRRAERPLVKVNCAALPESLVESELFGHERGAFTGAHRMRRGRFELASRGTLFLDEVGDLSLSTQVRLLRVVQEREIERVGGQTTIPVDVRLITATNQDLEKAIAEGRFREDLYYRLKVVTIEIPPLRERREDIPLLLDHFLHVYADEHCRPIRAFTDQAKEILTGYDWPGNVRELRNLVESLVVTTRGEEITAKALPPSIVEHRQPARFGFPLGKPLEDLERAYILRTLRMLDGNKTRAAKILGIGKKTLYRRLAQYGVPLHGDAAEDEAGPDGNGERTSALE